MSLLTFDDDFTEPKSNKKKSKPKEENLEIPKKKKKEKKKDYKIKTPNEIETILRKKHGIPNGINNRDVKTLLQNLPDIDHNEAYFLERILRERKSFQCYYELLKKY